MAIGAASSRFEAATRGLTIPMVGREQELGLLLDRWQQAQEGEGQVVLLSGEPGIGKSRVMSALRERLELQGAQALRQRAVEAERLGRENSMPFIWVVLAPIRHGLAGIRAGNIAEGLPLLQAGVSAWERSGGKSHNPYLKSAIAEGMALLGDLDGALHLIDEQIAQVERPGWGERVHYAEILRLKGWVLALKGDLNGAEQNYLASLDVARGQQAKSWELRTSTSLARLWQSQRKRKEAYDLLAPIYGWFTEGFDTKDLIDAQALIQELAE